MSRLSIAILILIVLGFIMTIQREEPGVITGTPSAGVVTPDNPKKSAKSANDAPTAGKSKPAGTTQVATAPKPATATPATNLAPAVTPQTNAQTQPTPQPQPSKQAALTEQQTAGNIPSSATISGAPAATPSESGILEGGENLGREAQRELARLGCFSGDITQRWGRDSRAAVKHFNQTSSFSWPDWPSRDMIASFRNFPDAYCKKCRNGAASCDVAAVDAQKDSPQQPVKSDAVVSTPPQPEAVKPVAPTPPAPPATVQKPADTPVQPAVKEAAPKPEPKTTAPQTTATAPAQPVQPSLEAAQTPNDSSKPKQSVASTDPDEVEQDAPDAPGYMPPPRINRAPRVQNPRAEPDERYYAPKPKARPQYSKPAWMHRRYVEREPVYIAPAPRRYGSESHRGGWSPRPQGVGR